MEPSLLDLYRDMLLALMSAGLGAVVGSFLVSRTYERKIARLDGQVALLQDQVDKLIKQLDNKISGFPN